MGSSWVGPVPSGEMGPDLFPAPGAGARPGGARPRLPPRLPHRQDGVLPGRDRQSLPSSQAGGEGTQSSACQGHVSRAWHRGWRPPDLVWGELPLGWGLSGSGHSPPLTKLPTSAFDVKTKTRSCNNYQMLGAPWSGVSLMTKGCTTTCSKSMTYLVDVSRAQEGKGEFRALPVGKSPRRMTCSVCPGQRTRLPPPLPRGH